MKASSVAHRTFAAGQEPRGISPRPGARCAYRRAIEASLGCGIRLAFAYENLVSNRCVETLDGWSHEPERRCGTRQGEVPRTTPRA